MVRPVSRWRRTMVCLDIVGGYGEGGRGSVARGSARWPRSSPHPSALPIGHPGSRFALLSIVAFVVRRLRITRDLSPARHPHRPLSTRASAARHIPPPTNIAQPSCDGRGARARSPLAERDYRPVQAPDPRGAARKGTSSLTTLVALAQTRDHPTDSTLVYPDQANVIGLCNSYLFGG